MNEVHQLASAILTIVFAAVMVVAAQLFIDHKSAKHPVAPALLSAAGDRLKVQ
jgi:hypothetical protein